MGLTLVWNNEYREDIPDAWIDKLNLILQQAGELENVHDGEVALTFVDNETIRELNRTYRGLDKETDVLSFAMSEQLDDEPDIYYGDDPDDPNLPPVGLLLGDIVISVPKAKEQSEAYGHSLEREIGFLFVHGFLHLLGYDHQDEQEEQRMFARQEQILAEVGLTR